MCFRIHEGPKGRQAVVALLAAVPWMLSKSYGVRHGPDIVLFLAIWFFGSRWVISLVIGGSRAHHFAIFIFYIAVSWAVESVIGMVV